MSSPIECLLPNILNAFEREDFKSHKIAIANKQISPQISYDNSDLPAAAPNAGLDTRTITIRETYLEFLWAYIYSIFVIYEEGINQPRLNSNFNGGIEFSSPILVRAKKLLDWSFSLRDEKTEWNVDLPNPAMHPNKYKDELEKEYILKANGIFIIAMKFILFHEFCHLVQGHDAFQRDKSPYNAQHIKETEKEADQYAYNEVVKSFDDEIRRLIPGISIVLAHCASLSLLRHLANIKQQYHPDLDDRLHASIENLALVDKGNLFYIKDIAGMSIKLLLINHGVDDNRVDFDTVDDCFDYYIEKLNFIKEGR